MNTLKYSILKLWLIIAIGTTFSSCHNKNKQEKKAPATKFSPIAKRVLFADSASFANRKYIENQPINPALADTTSLFSDPDSSSSIVTSLPALTKVVLLDTVPELGYDTLLPPNHFVETFTKYNWIKIRTPDNQEGYVTESSIAKYVFESDKKDIKYLILTNSKFNPEKNLAILKYSTTTQKLLSKVELWVSGEWEIDIPRIIITPLKNIETLIRIYTHGDYCGGGESEILVADAGKDLILFPETSNFFDDGGGIDGSTLYAPYKHKNVLYLLAGYNEDLLSHPGEEALIEYPTDINIPKDELLVMKSQDGQYVMDDDNEYVNDKNGNAKLSYLKKTDTYYRWNGNGFKIVKTKTTKIK